MTSINERLRDAQMHRSIDLQQYGAGVVKKMLAVLLAANDELAIEIASALLRLPPESFTVRRLEAQLASIRALHARLYAQVHAELQAAIHSLAEVEAEFQLELFRGAVPAPVQIRFPITGISVEQVYAAAISRPFQGRLLSGWASNLEASALEIVRNTIRMGYIEGQTTQQIVRRLIGTRANRYADGTLQRSRRDVTAVVNTALAHTAATAREQMYVTNSDLIKELIWHSALDTLTSEMCRARADKRYTPITHEPIGHSIPWGQGPSRIHWNCRSSALPVLKSFRELGFDVDELPPGTRASMDGQVPAEMTYIEWFKRQSAARQDEIVGPTRGQLMRSGRLPFDRLYTQRGQWLSLAALKKRNPEAFVRAFRE